MTALFFLLYSRNLFNDTPNISSLYCQCSTRPESRKVTLWRITALQDRQTDTDIEVKCGDIAVLYCTSAGQNRIFKFIVPSLTCLNLAFHPANGISLITTTRSTQHFFHPKLMQFKFKYFIFFFKVTDNFCCCCCSHFL